MLNLRRRREDRDRAAFTDEHVRARTDPAALVGLLRRAHTFAHPWLISEDHDYRDSFRRLAAAMAAQRKTHYSLRAHYERLEEVAVDAMLRFTSPDYVVTGEGLRNELASVLTAFKELDSLNDAAWKREIAAADTAGAVSVLMADARKTVGELTP